MGLDEQRNLDAGSVVRTSRKGPGNCLGTKRFHAFHKTITAAKLRHGETMPHPGQQAHDTVESLTD